MNKKIKAGHENSIRVYNLALQYSLRNWTFNYFIYILHYQRVYASLVQICPIMYVLKLQAWTRRPGVHTNNDCVCLCTYCM